ncbi:Spo0B domain-containing protein [Syntrophomonas erecta]
MTNEKILGLLRLIRHDFGNHLQVISGYMELERYEDAREYIISLIAELAEERKIFETCPAEPALFFYELNLLVNELGVILRYNRLKVASVQLLEKYQEPYKSIARLSKEVSWRDNPVFFLDINEQDNGNFIILIESDQLKNSPVTIEVKE